LIIHTQWCDISVADGHQCDCCVVECFEVLQAPIFVEHVAIVDPSGTVHSGIFDGVNKPNAAEDVHNVEQGT
jgi:hypothetical protein